jgi:flagellar hook-associated protein 2
MATGISFGGLGNGFDFQQVVTQLVSLQRAPIDQLTSDQLALRSKLTDYGTLGSNLLKLQSSAAALKLSNGFDRFTASSGDADVLSVNAASGATPGNYTLSVTQLAAAHQITNKATKAVATTSSSIVAGASATFSFTVGGGGAQTITLSTGASLDDLKTAINDLSAGVTASLLNTGTEATPSYRLVLTATATGSANAVAITADDTSLDFLNASGTGGIDTLQAAQNARIVLGDPTANPVSIDRSTNTVTDAIAGVTLTLKSITAPATTVNVAVSRDATAVKTDINAIVSAYNDIVKFINDRNTYDTEKKQGGVFYAEGATRTVLTRLRQALSDDVGGLTGLTAVGELGFKTERDGTIAITESTLDTALSTNYSGVKNLFIGQASSTGVAQRLSDAIDGLDAVDSGTLTLRQNGLTKDINSLSDRITQKQNSLNLYEEQLRLQYAQLDGLLRQMQSQMDFLKSRL